MNRLSIIVPALEEAAGIAACLARLQPLRGRGAQVVVGDGGSADGTVAGAGPSPTSCSSPPGAARPR